MVIGSMKPSSLNNASIDGKIKADAIILNIPRTEMNIDISNFFLSFFPRPESIKNSPLPDNF
jgi:hypothetical protein